MMDSMTSSTVHNGVIREVLAVVDHYRPEINKSEQKQVQHLVEWEKHRVDVVRKRLSPSVHWVESMRGKWSTHDPLVVRFVETLVDGRVVETSMDEIDTTIGEQNEGDDLHENGFPASGQLVNVHIKLGEPVDLHHEKWKRESHHHGKSIIPIQI